MKKIFIFLVFSLCSVIYAQTTICYKNNWETPSTIEDTPLDFGECKGVYSLNQMRKKGWEIADIKIETNKNLQNYTYFLVKNDTNIDSLKKEPIKQKDLISRKKFTIKPIGINLSEVKNNKANIDVGNLLVGTTGIVVHLYNNEKKQIIANAKVISSDENNSNIEFFEFNDLEQKALPKSKREVQVGDILVLNYMYPSSLLIAPTQETFQTVRDGFKYNNFLHSDLFAAKLKIDNQPYPTKKDIQNFAIKQNLGTIFIVVNQRVYILDTKTFQILTSYSIEYDTSNSNLPFYTRVEDIKESSFNFKFDLFSNKNNLTYKNYYKKLLGLN